MSELEERFLTAWQQRCPSLPPEREVVFSTKRGFRFDFAWKKKKVALEIQGNGPGHLSPKGLFRDCEKNLEATRLGWRVIYITSGNLKGGRLETTIKVIALALGHTYSPRYIPKRERQ